MNLHQIDIPGGFSGTVEVSEGNVNIKFPTATAASKIKRYNLRLLTPDKKNIEFNLLRFPDGEWCDYKYMQLDPDTKDEGELKEAAKKQIIRMGL